MPGKTARALCPVCQEPMPPDETECENCGAFVIDEAVVRLCRALGIPREKALALFEKGFRNPKQLADRDVDDVLKSGENGLLFLCTNCGGFVATGDQKCSRCGAEFEEEAEEPAPEKDILDMVLCPVCGADNEATWKECEICGEPLGGTEEPPGTEVAVTPLEPTPAPPAPEPPAKPATPPQLQAGEPATLEQIDSILSELEEAEPAETETKVRRVAKRARVPRRAKLPAQVPTPAAPPEAPPAPTVLPPTAVPLRPVARPPKPAIRPVPSPARTPPHRPQEPRRMLRAMGPTPGAAHARLWRETARVPSELTGGLVVAGAASLALAALLDQASVAWGIVFLIAGVFAYLAATALSGRTMQVDRVGTVSLLVGAVLSSAAPGLHQALAPALSVAGAVALAFGTRRVLSSKARDLITAACALPLVALGAIAGLGFAFAGSPAWMFGLLALSPWPAAVAAKGVRERHAGLLLGLELSKAETHMRNAEYAASVKDFDRAIAVTAKGAPGAETPWYGKGASLLLMGRYEEALRAIDKALDLNPRNEVAWLNKGNALTKMGRLTDALRCFNAAIEVNPRYEVAWNNKGNTLARLTHYEEALACYDRALELDPGYRGAWVNKGYVLTKMGRYDEATSCADRALRLNERVRTGTV